MISQLLSVGHILSEEQQVLEVIRSLPNNLEHLKVNLTFNDSIKTLSDVECHVEHEDERLCAAKDASSAFVAELSGTKSSSSNARKIEKLETNTKTPAKDSLRKRRT